MPQASPITARQATPARSLPVAVRRFLQTEASSAVVLVVAAVIALLWANSPWSHSYVTFWHKPVVVQIGSIRFDEDLHAFVNDGLMAVFFFVVGLEIKRELVSGELTDRRVAALPVLAAIGGMVVPAATYLAIIGMAGTGGSHGWGIPMATDIAFAVGVLALLGPRVPPTLKVLLLTLAIVDDIGAILVIALAYSGSVHVGALAVAASGVVATVVLRRLRVDWAPLYIAIGVVAWYATFRSGIHATIAGVVFGLIMPATPLAPNETVKRWAQDLSDEPSAGQVQQMVVIARQSISPVERIEERLHPVSSFVILPLFALANAGVEIRAGVLSHGDAGTIALAVVVALVLGKFVGILLGSWAGVRLRIATVPADVQWVHLAGMAALGGIGFTVSIFVAGLAFTDAAMVNAAKLAVLAASVIASCAGAAVFALSRRSNERVRP